jgi:hypothetical protein
MSASESVSRLLPIRPVVSGPATISGNTVTIAGVGSFALQASQAASGSYTTATATTSFTVSPAHRHSASPQSRARPMG